MKALLTGLLLAGSLAAAAQTAPPAFTSSCQTGGSSTQRHFCETRDLRMAAPTGQPLTIDGGANGGITVHGWDGPDVRIRATVQAQGEGAAEAQLKATTITAADGSLRATTASRQVSVSFEVFVPRRLALSLRTGNGGIELADLQGNIDFRAQNGGVSLADLGGQVTGRTLNGGLTIRLGGGKWAGQGLDVATTNGGITWTVPASYSAQFFTSTDNGDIRTIPALPATGRRDSHRHQVSATLGSGGQPVRATTTNGGIIIEQG